MNGPRIAQLHAGFADGDAISRQSQLLHGLFARVGLTSELYAVDERISPTMQSVCRPLSAYDRRTAEIAVLHYGIASPATEAFLASAGRKILVYHNVTPGHFFVGFDDDLARRLDAARAELGAVALRADAVWGVSEFDAQELRDRGIPHVEAFELLFSPAELQVPPEPRITAAFDRTMKNVLFVGRIAPNKCVEELIIAFAWYRATLERKARLVIVGSKHTCPRYNTMLTMLANELGVENVHFEGFASRAGLATYYDVADLFVCPSRHEGYCLPLVEALAKKVPVIARDIGGMPQALGGSGLLYDEASPAEMASLMHGVLTDDALRASMLAAQSDRLARVLDRPVETELRSLLSRVVPDRI